MRSDIDRYISSGRVVSIGRVVTLAAVAGLVVTQVINFGIYRLRIGALNSNVHESIFGVVSLAANGAAVAGATARGRRSDRAAWLLVAALMSALLVVRLTASYDTALLVPPVAVLFASLWKLTSDDEPAPRAVIRGALALLALSFLVHAVGPKTLTALGYSGNAWPYQLKGILKHTTEMAGWMLLASGLFAGVSDPKEGRLGNAS